MKVFVGLSGGVDSAVSAALLKEEGHDVTGVFIRIALPGYPCPAEQDKISAQRVAAHLRIPFFSIDLSKEYQEDVFKETVSEFKKGRTPNPDTLCNQKIKFGAFYNFAKAHGAEKIATGHYAQVATKKYSSQKSSGSPQTSAQNIFSSLIGGNDKEKDQSYFLWMVPEEVLGHTLFPVGGLQKKEVRALAEKFGLPNAKRKDSQGLCFLGDISITEMLERETGPTPGDVLNESGEVVGTHKGVALYTLGQRHGFELHASGPNTPPHYVVAKNSGANTLIVSINKFPTNASKTKIELTNCNWIGEVENGRYEARYRYRQQLVSAELTKTSSGAEVILSEPHYVPEGQSLVLYHGERCVGGGVIERAELI